MISVVTLTYRRHHLLQEAIHSFLVQDIDVDTEMIVINDAPDVTYSIDDDRVKIINSPDRFTSIGKKLEYGLKQAKYDYVYRLDDDDLLTPWGLGLVASYINEADPHDVYRCPRHYFYCNNKFECLGGSVNNGNCYSREYIDRITFPDVSVIEDSEITFGNNASIYTGNKDYYSMIYRWGMATSHISGIGNYDSQVVFDTVDSICKETGYIHLRPHFNDDYYSQLINVLNK